MAQSPDPSWESTCPVKTKHPLFSPPHSASVCPQVNQVQDDAAPLQKAYAGEKADDIHRSEHAVTTAWEGLLEAGQARRLLLLDTVEKFRFFNMVRDLMLWMDGVNLQIDAHDSPRWLLALIWYCRCVYQRMLSDLTLLRLSLSVYCHRDVSSAGLVIANHQDIKSEIETRANSFTACIEMGNSLINKNHYAADEVLSNR